MNISAKERLATGTSLAAIGLIAVAIGWAYLEGGDANRERQQAGAITLALSELRLETFEYRQHRLESARTQWNAVSDRLDRLIADSTFSGAAQKDIIGDLRKRRVLVRSLFASLSAAPAAQPAGAAGDEARRRFENQIHGRLLSAQQDGFNDAFRLSTLAVERINAAQQRVLVVASTGLALIALITVGASWHLRRGILEPVDKLQRATREIAAGRWNHRLGIGGHDEISALAANFASMVRTLHDSQAGIELRNLELAALNAELEAFSYSVSHDLRSPLRSMDGFSQALLEDYGDRLDEEGKDSLRRIRAASQRMGQLIDDLLALAQVNRADLKVAPVDLSAGASAIADALGREEPGRAVEWAIEDGLIVRADPALARILLQNLLQNAWKFTGRTERPVIRVGALEHQAGKVHFVADNGAGFDMAYSEKLFGAFQRLHQAADFPGTGIGLAIVRRIIRRHGGNIWAEAKPGEGATFFFSVPEPEGIEP